MKIGICGNFNFTVLANELNERLEGHEFIVGKDGAFFEELDRPSGEFGILDLCIIALDWRELSPLLYAFAFGDNPGEALGEFHARCERIKKSIVAVRSRKAVPILVFSPITEHRSCAGFINRLLDNSPFDLFAQCQRIFNELCKALPDVYPVDFDEISAQIGKDRAFDSMSSARSHQPFAPIMVDAVARRIRAMIVQLRSYPLKCIVLDLDNTLWGGVVGEDGFDRIELGTSGRGKAYWNFQMEVVKLYKQGTLLAVCSKNNTCDALDVIERHPYMLIRPNMISCFRINWEDKPKNLVEIAAQLGIGLDSIMFVDDSPVERAIMRAALPDVTILELPEAPELFVNTLRACTRFWPIQLTRADSSRADAFSRQDERAALQKLSDNKETYLKALEIRLTLGAVTESSIERATQLFNKTNQFNLTGARYTRGELDRLIKAGENRLFYMEMSDKFGDYGIIGVALVCGDTIESFALSCRAFGRSIEQAFLVFVLSKMREMGCERALGKFIFAPRNAMTKEFYKNAGFSPWHESANESTWVFKLLDPLPAVAPWINYCH
jgi:FkbH-like protein